MYGFTYFFFYFSKKKNKNVWILFNFVLLNYLADVINKSSEQIEDERDKKNWWIKDIVPTIKL